MYCEVDNLLISEFEELLVAEPPRGRQKEQVVQDFLEHHSELIPTPNLLNHRVYFDSIVSKFPLSADFVTDYVYITTSSALFRVTFVELEAPEKPIFVSSMKRVNTSAPFNAALDQVRTWRSFVEQNRSEIIRMLAPLLDATALRGNPVEFNYQLVIGRSSDKNASAGRMEHLRSISTSERIDILSYDSVLNWYRRDQFSKRKNVLRRSGSRYAFKLMHFLPDDLFGYMGPDGIDLSDEQMERLRVAGYEIDKWRSGQLLTWNGRKTSESSLSDRLSPNGPRTSLRQRA